MIFICFLSSPSHSTRKPSHVTTLLPPQESTNDPDMVVCKSIRTGSTHGHIVCMPTLYKVSKSYFLRIVTCLIPRLLAVAGDRQTAHETNPTESPRITTIYTRLLALSFHPTTELFRSTCTPGSSCFQLYAGIHTQYTLVP